jgi:hypothetical protein
MTQRPTNFVLWLVIALPLIAVAASLASLALAVNSGDTELPKDYHWEGAALDNDQQRLALAARERIGATISYQSDTQRCAVALHGAAPTQLRLSLVHPTDPRADRRLTLARAGGGARGVADASYETDCAGLPAAHWWLEVADDAGRWLLRGRSSGRLQPPVQLGAP